MPRAARPALRKKPADRSSTTSRCYDQLVAGDARLRHPGAVRARTARPRLGDRRQARSGPYKAEGQVLQASSRSAAVQPLRRPASTATRSGTSRTTSAGSSPLESAAKIYRAHVLERLQGDQGRRPERPGPDRRDVAVRSLKAQARDRRRSTFLRKMTCVNRTFTQSQVRRPEGRRLRPPPLRLRPQADATSTRARTTRRSARSGSLTTRARPARRRPEALTHAEAAGALDLYLTEYGYFRSGKRKVAESQARASTWSRRFEIAQQNPRVQQMLQYLIVQPAQEVPVLRHEHRVLARRPSPGASRLLAEVGADRRCRAGAIARRRRSPAAWTRHGGIAPPLGRRQWRRQPPPRTRRPRRRSDALPDDPAGAAAAGAPPYAGRAPLDRRLRVSSSRYARARSARFRGCEPFRPSCVRNRPRPLGDRVARCSRM